MGKLKQLAGQTAIYGLSSIVPRLLNYLLVPLYTTAYLPSEYGKVTELYAYLSFLSIILTYGMETGFFKFWQSEKGNPKVYTTTLISLFITSITFIFFSVIFAKPTAVGLGYEHNPEYVIWLSIIIGLEAITAIPFALLRQQNRPVRFAALKFINIAIQVILNLFFILLCPYLVKKGYLLPTWLFDPSIGIGYIFISNLIAIIFTLIMLVPTMYVKWVFDTKLWKRIMVYSLPLLVAGLAGMVNETFDRVMLKRLVADASTAMDQLGIYGANYKLAVLMTLFIQTFRFAAEPFFFNQSKEKDAKELYAEVMKYFIIFGLFIFLGVMLYIDIVKGFIGKNYHSGLVVVPILLLANLFLGIFFNLSIWYKLTGKTIWGVYLALFGATITIVLNFWLIPIIGYLGAAWATLACYFLIMVASYFIGNHFYKVNYPLVRIGIYFLFASVIFTISQIIKIDSRFISLSINTILLLLYVGFVYYMEPSLRQKFNKR
ncbi:MAG: oligosaccharide flippase family protein [Bacteroidia bacterium]|nr:oligosaccharide flippase family protein [Bacteroidia bacterium]